jgi:hypothetical protein
MHLRPCHHSQERAGDLRTTVCIWGQLSAYRQHVKDAFPFLNSCPTDQGCTWLSLAPAHPSRLAFPLCMTERVPIFPARMGPRVEPFTDLCSRAIWSSSAATVRASTVGEAPWDKRQACSLSQPTQQTVRLYIVHTLQSFRMITKLLLL